MIHITPDELYSSIYKKVQANPALIQFQKEEENLIGLSCMHRTTHCVQNDEIVAFTSYIPTNMLSHVKHRPTYRYIQDLEASISYPLVQDQFSQFSECVLVPFIAFSEQYVRQSLYFASVQAIYKNLPLVIPTRACPYDFSLLRGVVSNDNYSVIFPRFLPQFILTEPSPAGPFASKTGTLLHPVQIETQIEISQAVLIIQDAFVNDPVYQVYCPNVQKRREMLKDMTVQLARDTGHRGTNFLYCEGGIFSVQRAQICILGSPPGTKDEFFGSELGYAKVMIKHLGMNYLNIENTFDKMHEECCGHLFKHYYVALLGTSDPGQGLGTVALQIPNDIVQQVTAEIYIDNSNERNLKFYGKEGFQIYGEYVITHKGKQVKAWGMRKNITYDNSGFLVKQYTGGK
ncbi:Conserved_hypothetical protein [Hexamita inflata]|uniref:Uncharacterized protein n=1 Tax=Hexamita inflata TaxID=28002 RepID=A0AA86R1C6_9EUKA|nr:Conserved hypothetical protein [Hexamita inflata]